MSVDREDYFCNNCHNEFIFDLPLAISLKEGIFSTEILYSDNLSKIFL